MQIQKKLQNKSKKEIYVINGTPTRYTHALLIDVIANNLDRRMVE